MRYVLRATVWGCMFLSSGGCDLVGNIGQEDECDRTQFKRELVEEAVVKLLDDALWVALMSHGGERAYSLTLIGVDQGSRGIATLAEDCTEPVEFEPFCDAATRPPGEEVEPFWQTHDRCGRLACEAAGVGIAEVYFTMIPRTEPDDRHEFFYESTSLGGTVVYDPNPLIRWRADQTDPALQAVDADVDIAVTIERTRGEAIDASHDGSVRATSNADGLLELELAISFPEILEDGRVLSVALLIDATGAVSGGMSADGATVGTITGDDHSGVGFTWLEECEE